jgi:hypothetical protein
VGGALRVVAVVGAAPMLLCAVAVASLSGSTAAAISCATNASLWAGMSNMSVLVTSSDSSGHQASPSGSYGSSDVARRLPLPFDLGFFTFVDEVAFTGGT